MLCSAIELPQLKVFESILSFLFFFMENSILYARITVSQKCSFQNSILNGIQAFYFYSYKNVCRCANQFVCTDLTDLQTRFC